MDSRLNVELRASQFRISCENDDDKVPCSVLRRFFLFRSSGTFSTVRMYIHIIRTCVFMLFFVGIMTLYGVGHHVFPNIFADGKYIGVEMHMRPLNRDEFEYNADECIFHNHIGVEKICHVEKFTLLDSYLHT